MAKRSWFGRWLVRVAERLARRYYEGPDPPRRIAQAVDSFVVLHPKASRWEWTEFARLQCEESYRSGYVRGVERSVRDRDYSVEPHLLEAARRRELPGQRPEAREPRPRWTPPMWPSSSTALST